jgi:hypothetical protein
MSDIDFTHSNDELNEPFSDPRVASDAAKRFERMERTD